MQDELFPAAEKILTDIENVFKRDKNLRDFEILPVSVGENKSPVLHADHTLGLQEWSVRHLYLHVYHKLMNLKKQQRLRREDPNVMSRLLLGGVLLNPDCSLLWNMRREFVVIGRFDPLSELHINAVTLSRRPKTSQAFIYRRWILNRLSATPLDAATSSQLLDEELRVSVMAADRYANNYHAWNHRMWVMSHLPQAQEILSEEWIFSEKWVASHVSEHSGYYYREYLLKQIPESLGHSELCFQFHETLGKFFSPLKNSDLKGMSFKGSPLSKSLYSMVLEVVDTEDLSSVCPIRCEQYPHVLCIGLLAYELLLITELIHLYPGHEALWCHRRFVLFSFYTLAKKINVDISGENDITDGVPLPKTQKLSVSDHEDTFVWKVVMWHEDKLIGLCTAVAPEDCYQSKLAHRHLKWIEKVLLQNRGYCDTPCTT